MRRPHIVAGLILWCTSAFAQTNTVAGAGYLYPAPIPAAPGQILTLFVSGVGRSLTQPVRAQGAALPKSLAGISVTLRQVSDIPVPLFEVRPIFTCLNPLPGNQGSCGSVTAITVQIPYELRPLCPVCASPLPLNAQLFVTENGNAGGLIDLTPLADQIHIVTTCDTIVPGSTGRASITGLPCPPMVTHGDGALVSAANPAKPGEELVAYAVGLGATDPPAATGQPATTAARTASSLRMGFNFLPNALPAKPTPLPSPRAAPVTDPFPISGLTPVPIFSGLTPGYVGLYQINFLAPAVPAGTPACQDPNRVAPGADFVQSNVTVSFGSVFSFDGAGICVAVPN
jgi:hypothetical protein